MTKFKTGDRVVFTNEYGVCFGVKTVLRPEPPYTPGGEQRYLIDPTDSPWYATEESRLTLADEADEAAQKRGDTQHFRDRYEFPTTDAQREALLDTDPFEEMDT